jgi:hypothetical protein
MKGYLAIREGDILCVAQNSSAAAKHMADLICKSIGFPRGAQYGKSLFLKYSILCFLFSCSYSHWI